MIRSNGNIPRSAMKCFLIVPAALLLASLHAAPLPAQSTGQQPRATNGSVALPDHAHVDTIRGRLSASGTGVAAERFTEAEAVQRAACLAAELDARRKLVELAQGFGLDSSTVVQDYVTKSDVSRAKSGGALGPVAVDKETMVEPRTCRVIISAKLPGDMRHLLPLTIDPMEPTTEIRVPIMDRAK